MRGEMSVIVRTIARITYALILVFGFYVILHGHLTPGGGFQGGAVVASGFALLPVAFGAAAAKRYLNPSLMRHLEEVGSLAFLALGFLGIGISFFYNVLANSGSIFGAAVPFGPNSGILNSAGTLPFMNWAVGLKVMTGLMTIVLVLLIGAGKEGKD
jgi:multicomponent Na+:H+ antiporter subunit B